MKNLTIALENRPGALAEMGEALGRAGVSIEGGGAFVVEGEGLGYFLFPDGEAARKALWKPLGFGCWKRKMCWCSA